MHMHGLVFRRAERLYLAELGASFTCSESPEISLRTLFFPILFLSRLPPSPLMLYCILAMKVLFKTFMILFVSDTV